jgi:hypothetical protein
MIDRTSLGTFERATDDTVDTIKAKELQDGSVLVTHTWTFSGLPAGHRVAVKAPDAWKRQHDYLLANDYQRALAR